MSSDPFALLLAPFDYQFMTRGILVGTLIGAVCGWLSCYVVLKGWSLLGDALSHAVVPGIAIAYALGLPFAPAAFISALLAVGGIGLIKGQGALKSDAAIGVVFSAFLALGLVLISLNPGGVQLTTILFGNLLGIGDSETVQLIIISLVCILALSLRWKDLMLYCFDEGHARVMGLNTVWLNVLLLSMLSLMTVGALQAVGALLVVAMLITPGACAWLLTDRFGHMLWLAPLIGALCAFTGSWASYFMDSSVGGAIVLLQTLCFLVILVLAPRHGLLARRRRPAPDAVGEEWP